MSYFVFYCWLFICKLYIADQLPRVGKRELICLLSFTCNYVASVRRGCLFFLVLWMDCVIYCGTLWAFHVIFVGNKDMHNIMDEFELKCVFFAYAKIRFSHDAAKMRRR